MAYTWDQVILDHADEIQQQRAHAIAELDAARIREDADGVRHGRREVTRLDSEWNALNVRASEYIANQNAAPQRHPSGLSDEELPIAKTWTTGGTEEQNIADYVRNKAKYQHMRATGEYRDDQGTVRR